MFENTRNHKITIFVKRIFFLIYGYDYDRC